MESHSHYEVGDPELEAAQNALPRANIPATDLAAWRSLSVSPAGLEADFLDGVRFGEVQIAVGDGEITAYTYRPGNASEEETFPLVINIHGGAFCIGSAAMDHHICRDFVLNNGLTVLNLEYRMAPEHPYPTPVDDCFAALEWATKHTRRLAANLEKGLILCGTSAGASIAAAVAIMARDDEIIRHKPTGQILIIPETYSKGIHPLQHYQESLQSLDKLLPGDPVLGTIYLKMTTDYYEGQTSKPELMKPKRSPLLARSHAGLPRAVVLVSGRDPLRDEGILYSQLLAKANGGDHVKLHIYRSAEHGFHIMLPQTPAAKRLFADLQDGVNWLLHQP